MELNMVNIKEDDIKIRDVQDIRIPAYVVKEIKTEVEIEGGCVVNWNPELVEFTNFTPPDLNNQYCYQIFNGIQEERDQSGKCIGYIQLCGKECKFRSSKRSSFDARVLRNVWIDCISERGARGKKIKKLVDIYIFPFKTEENTFALHLPIYKGKDMDSNRFNEEVAKKGLKIPSEWTENAEK